MPKAPPRSSSARRPSASPSPASSSRREKLASVRKTQTLGFGKSRNAGNEQFLPRPPEKVARNSATASPNHRRRSRIRAALARLAIAVRLDDAADSVRRRHRIDPKPKRRRPPVSSSFGRSYCALSTSSCSWESSSLRGRFGTACSRSCGAPLLALHGVRLIFLTTPRSPVASPRFVSTVMASWIAASAMSILGRRLNVRKWRQHIRVSPSLRSPFRTRPNRAARFGSTGTIAFQRWSDQTATWSDDRSRGLRRIATRNGVEVRSSRISERTVCGLSQPYTSVSGIGVRANPHQFERSRHMPRPKA